MKITCLSHGLHGSCVVVKHRSYTILIDPFLSPEFLLHFKPVSDRIAHDTAGTQHTRKLRVQSHQQPRKRKRKSTRVQNSGTVVGVTDGDIRNGIVSQSAASLTRNEPAEVDHVSISGEVSSALYSLKSSIIHGSLHTDISDSNRHNTDHNSSSPHEREGLESINGRVYVSGKPHCQLPALEGIDLSSVDIILCSNWHSCLALPYITEYTSFRGFVYATEATKILARQAMMELSAYDTRLPWTADTHLTREAMEYVHSSHSVAPECIREIYSCGVVQSCVEKIQEVSFNQPISISGVLTLTATSAGHSLGSCCWSVQTSIGATSEAQMMGEGKTREDHHIGEKLVYMSATSLDTANITMPFDPTCLKHCDALIMTGLSPRDPYTPTPLKHVITRILKEVLETVLTGGSVLFPVHPSGSITLLLEELHAYLNSHDRQGVPFYVVSPTARASALYANIFTEWLNQHRADKVYTPEYPFEWDKLIRAQRLTFISDINDPKAENLFRKPCVIFAGHPSLRLGDGVAFLWEMGQDPRNLVVCTEPEYAHSTVLDPFRPLGCRETYCAMDTRMDVREASELLAKYTPPLLLLPDVFSPDKATSYTTDRRPILSVEVNRSQTALLSMTCGVPIKISVSKPFRAAAISNDLAALTKPVAVGNGNHFAPVSGLLNLKDNENLLVVDTDPPRTDGERVWDMRRHLTGNLAVVDICTDLVAQLPANLEVTRHPTLTNTHVLKLTDIGVTITLSPATSHIAMRDDNDTLRQRIKAVLLKYLKEY
ncbi:hypothetical protein SARC_03506 [Sphaeroforma arctica JP610]|uniref:Beta-Casp domain-containing protein n=1 Tax=Sphaeroforma arctica JP610 TaxID=667725 RepID=A0A0L0G5H5_9EUKA|nr:hypothetical protein SARC_03506 [Sphaeroforma arctica JP610]KNC84280.1 hypothetical protein SARC_03506 [Sphaeroforma arctica JP610]|eukprot:XP_014158182.1 hypothetical protein SARC_03506 [Sphaeroforma arctica JP610]